MKKKNIFLIIFIIFALEFQIKAEEYLEDAYYFQLYPSVEKGKNFLFHAYTPDAKFLTINTTEGTNCPIIKNEAVDEYPIKGLSSVIAITDLVLVKTCFGPNKIVEVIFQNNETPEKKILWNSNQNLNNIKFCYSTFISHPIYSYTSIITYWTEFELKNGKETYTHKTIIFDLNKRTFSKEKILSMKLKDNSNFYAKNCITFRYSDIYCSINFDSSNTTSKKNSFIIDTKTLYSSDSNIHLVTSNTDYGRNIYQKPILIGKVIHGIDGGSYDTFLTEYHNKEENTTLFVASLFRKSIYYSLISLSSTTGVFYGINIEFMYISKNLFNHLMPDQNDLIVIYAMKYGNGMGIYMSRFNLTQSINIHKFREYSLSNYVIPNICSNPQYIQSIFVTSFINYDAQDKEIMKRNTNENYYKYQRDIASVIACKDGSNQVKYETHKIKMLQCLNTLDILNNNNKHIIKLKGGMAPVILDIYNDPNFKSLRDVSIEFLPTALTDDPIIIIVTDKNGNTINVNLRQTTIINNPAIIKFFNTITFYTKNEISIQYRLKQSAGGENALTCHLSSDICNFEFKLEDTQGQGGKCDIPYCLYCNDQSKCIKCDDYIPGLHLDTESNSCICDEEKGFKSSPKTKNNIKMCVCKNNYSFYKNTDLCLSNSILNNGSFYQDRIDDFSSISIYEDCPNNCLGCKMTKNNEFCCTEIKENNVNLVECSSLDGNVSLICLDCDTTDTTDIIIKEDICLDQELIWFKMGDYKFYFAKINNCIFVFQNNSLFFYSNKTDCKNINDYDYIAQCLNNNRLSNREYYLSFLDRNYEYNPQDTDVNIYRIIDDYKFHLVSTQTNNNFTELVISRKCTEKLIKEYDIDPNYKNLLIFKVDITRNITRQIEYQIFNPEPQIMYQTLNISLCLSEEKNNKNKNSTRRVLDQTDQNNTELAINEVIVSVPIDWNETQLEIIDELYNNNSIFFFNETNDFYNDVCNTYETTNSTDIYLQDRRERYYITDPLCESGCTLIDYNNITKKIICKCPIKTSTDNYENSDFLERNLDKAFDDTYILPNIRVLKCFKQALKVVDRNLLFYLTFFSIIGFILAYIFLTDNYALHSKDPFDILTNKIEEKRKKLEGDNTSVHNGNEEVRNLISNPLEENESNPENNNNITNKKRNIKNGNSTESEKLSINSTKKKEEDTKTNATNKRNNDDKESLISHTLNRNEENDNNQIDGNNTKLIEVKKKGSENKEDKSNISNKEEFFF